MNGWAREQQIHNLWNYQHLLWTRVTLISFLSHMRPPCLSNNWSWDTAWKTKPHKLPCYNFPATLFMVAPYNSITLMLNLTQDPHTAGRPFLSSIAGYKWKKYCCCCSPQWPPIKDAGDSAGGAVNQTGVPGVNRRQAVVSLSHDQGTMTRAWPFRPTITHMPRTLTLAGRGGQAPKGSWVDFV